MSGKELHGLQHLEEDVLLTLLEGDVNGSGRIQSDVGFECFMELVRRTPGHGDRSDPYTADGAEVPHNDASCL